MPDYDLVIRNGTVLDGSGRPGIRADVAVSGTTIASVGRVDGRGREEIDAEGRVVTPGFIDGHTHMDAQVFWDRAGTSSCWHGITSVVMGNCGFTLAPARADQRPLVVRNLERAEDISGAAMAEGIDWTWSSFAEYLDAVDRLPKGINYAANIGHSALRTWAMGERAFEQTASDDDLAVMTRELEAALAAGAFGFTTSRSDQHETSDDRPVASRLASWAELCALVGTMGARGGGVFQLTSEAAAHAPDHDRRAEYFGRLRELALTSRVPVTFSVPASATGFAALDLIDDTVAAGGRMFGLGHSRGVAVVLSFRTRLPFDALPEWREVRGLPLAGQRARLTDPEVRARLVHAATHGDYGRAIGAEARKPDFANMRVMRSPHRDNPSVAAEAAARGVDPVEHVIDLALESDFRQFFVQQIVPQTPDDLVRVMKHPRVVMTFSDAGAHVSQILDCSIQTHLLSWWVREQQAFTLAEAVRMLTLEPANAWGLADRGLVQAGMAADLNVFDPETVGPAMPEVVDDLPGGSRRLVQRAHGFAATVVGGQVTLRDGESTGAAPGRLLRRGVR